MGLEKHNLALLKPSFSIWSGRSLVRVTRLPPQEDTHGGCSGNSRQRLLVIKKISEVGGLFQAVQLVVFHVHAR